MESIIKNHPFVDGNKRTALLAAAALLLSYHYELIANEDDTYNKIIEIASSHLEFDNIVEWIKQYSTKI
ncbi:MAG: type II toxin-antitoxin system death-on-curing family toxin [Chitinophagaceae bacterium]